MWETQHQKGFTLVELIIVIAILAILASVVVPNFSTLIQNNNLTTNTNEFITALNFTRSEAIKRGVPVTICHANAARTNCDNSNTRWEDGWIIFTGGTIVPAGNNINVTTPTIIRVHEPVAVTNFEIRGRPKVAKFVSYNSQGVAINFNGLLQNATFTLCNDDDIVKSENDGEWSDDGANARVIAINTSGRVYSMVGNDRRNRTVTACFS